MISLAAQPDFISGVIGLPSDEWLQGEQPLSQRCGRLGLPKVWVLPSLSRAMSTADHAGWWQGPSFSLPRPCLLRGDANAWQAPKRDLPHDGDLGRARDGGRSQSHPRCWRVRLPGMPGHRAPLSCGPEPTARARPPPALSGEALYFKTANEQLDWCEMRVWKRPQPPQTV